MPLSGPLKKIYEEYKKPPEQAPSDWALIEAAKVAKGQLNAIRKDLAIKFQELVLGPQEVRQAIDDDIQEMEAEILRLQEEIIIAKEQYAASEQTWVQGQQSYEAIEIYYRPQITSLDMQASYVPLSQRATVSRRKRKKPKNND